jgi:CheY-like chemotaxis protein
VREQSDARGKAGLARAESGAAAARSGRASGSVAGAARGRARRAVAAPRHAPPQPRPDCVTVLLAEDDPDVQNLVRHVLEADGYHVEVAGDGEEALTRYQACRPSLLVLDIMMPRLTGFEVLARLRAMGGEAASVPVLVLSARASEGDIVSGFDLGSADYVTKPFMIGELRARVRSLLARA